MLIASYCRVSTDSADQINSFENQKTYFEREIIDKGYSLYRIYADKGLTGTKLNNRPEFEKMIIDAGIDVKKIKTGNDNRIKNYHTFYQISDRDPLFDEIWIKNTSRFARNTLSYEIINLLRQKKVNIFFLEQNINTSDMTQDFMLKLFQLFDEQDSKDKSIKVRTGIKESVKKGMMLTNSKLYGYKFIKHENRLEIIPKEAEVIKKIYQLYADGEGIRRIVNYLEDHHLFTRLNKPFCRSSVRRILDNEKYAGLNNPLKYDTGIVMQKNTYPKKKENYTVEPCDRIPAIISKEIFEKCQKTLESKINYQQQKGVYRGISKYGSLIYCGKCGKVYYSNVDQGRKFYNCSTKKSKGTSTCDNPNVSQSIIDNYINELANGGLYKYILDIFEVFKTELFELIYSKLQQINKDNTALAETLNKKIKNKKAELAKLYTLAVRENSNTEIINNLMEDTEKTLKILNIEYANACKNNEVIIKEIINLYDYYLHLKEAYAKIKKIYTHEEVINQIDKIIVSNNDSHPLLNIRLKFYQETIDYLNRNDIQLNSEKSKKYSLKQIKQNKVIGQKRMSSITNIENQIESTVQELIKNHRHDNVPQE